MKITRIVSVAAVLLMGLAVNLIAQEAPQIVSGSRARVSAPSFSRDQLKRVWLLHAEAGRYQIHDWKASGLALGLKAGRRLLGTSLFFDFGIMLGLGEDEFMSFEPGVELQIGADQRVSPFFGAGVGIMFEFFSESFPSSPSLPYYAVGGLAISFDARNRIRFAVRRGSHTGIGEAGVFAGPHLFTAGWLHQF